MNYSPGSPFYDFPDYPAASLHDHALFSHPQLDASLSVQLIVLPALHTPPPCALILCSANSCAIHGLYPPPPPHFASIYHTLLHLSFRCTSWITDRTPGTRPLLTSIPMLHCCCPFTPAVRMAAPIVQNRGNGIGKIGYLVIVSTRPSAPSPLRSRRLPSRIVTLWRSRW